MKIKFPYWQILAIPVLLFASGFMANQAVLIANHGKFPVLLNNVQQQEAQKRTEKVVEFDGVVVGVVPDRGPADPQYLKDDYHTVMGPNSHLKILADIFNIDGVYSIGDGLIFLASWLWKFIPIVWLTLMVRKNWGV